MNKKYFSNASWTRIPNSQDEHDTFEDANMICMLLENDYGLGKANCSIRGTCLETWVTDESGKKIKKHNKQNR